MQTAYAFTFNDVNSTKLYHLDAQKSLALNGVNMGRITLYIVAIVIVIVTRLRWTKHGRKVTKQKIVVESIFYLALSSIVIFDSFYHVGIPVLYLVLYLILFLGLQQYSYMHSNRLIAFWKETKVCFYLCKGRNTHTCCFCNRNSISYHNLYLIHW